MGDYSSKENLLRNLDEKDSLFEFESEGIVDAEVGPKCLVLEGSSPQTKIRKWVGFLFL